MTPPPVPTEPTVLDTDRLRLRPWREAEAPILRRLWTERDPRVPPHRRIGADGRPTVAELEEQIRAEQPSAATRTGLLAVQRRAEGDVMGYAGLVDRGRGADGEPEIAFELLQQAWGHGYATEAMLAVVAWARSLGHRRLWATVWDWNSASRRVLAKAGFHETGRQEVHPTSGTTLFTALHL